MRNTIHSTYQMECSYNSNIDEIYWRFYIIFVRWTYEPYIIFNNPFIFHQTLKQNGKSSWIYNGRYSLSVEWWFKFCSDLEWCIPSAVQGLGTSSKNHWGKSFYRELFSVSLWNPICQVDGLLPHSDLHTLQVFLHSNILICL